MLPKVTAESREGGGGGGEQDQWTMTLALQGMLLLKGQLRTRTLNGQSEDEFKPFTVSFLSRRNTNDQNCNHVDWECKYLIRLARRAGERACC